MPYIYCTVLTTAVPHTSVTQIIKTGSESVGIKAFGHTIPLAPNVCTGVVLLPLLHTTLGASLSPHFVEMA